MNTPEQARANLFREMKQIFHTANRVLGVNEKKLEAGADTTSQGAAILKTIKAAQETALLTNNVVYTIQGADAVHTAKAQQTPRAVAG